jgi:hypothetical protein
MNRDHIYSSNAMLAGHREIRAEVTVRLSFQAVGQSRGARC